MSFLSHRDGLVWIYRHMNIWGNAHPYEIMWTSCCISTRVLRFWHIPIHDKGLQQLLLYLCQKKVALLAQRSSGPELGGFAGKENRSAFQVGMPRQPKHFQRRFWSWCNFPFFKIHHVTPVTMTKSRKSKTWPDKIRGPRWRVLRTLATLMTIQIQTKSLLLSMRWGAWSRFVRRPLWVQRKAVDSPIKMASVDYFWIFFMGTWWSMMTFWCAQFLDKLHGVASSHPFDLGIFRSQDPFTNWWSELGIALEATSHSKGEQVVVFANCSTGLGSFLLQQSWAKIVRVEVQFHEIGSNHSTRTKVKPLDAQPCCTKWCNAPSVTTFCFSWTQNGSLGVPFHPSTWPVGQPVGYPQNRHF